MEILYKKYIKQRVVHEEDQHSSENILKGIFWTSYVFFFFLSVFLVYSVLQDAPTCVSRKKNIYYTTRSRPPAYLHAHQASLADLLNRRKEKKTSHHSDIRHVNMNMSVLAKSLSSETNLRLGLSNSHHENFYRDYNRTGSRHRFITGSTAGYHMVFYILNNIMCTFLK